MNETTQQEKTTELSSRNEQLNSAAGTKQLNSSVGTKQLDSALPSTACNRLQPPATAYNHLYRLYSRIGFFYLLPAYNAHPYLELQFLILRYIRRIKRTPFFTKKLEMYVCFEVIYSSKTVAAVAEWYRYRTVACFVTGSNPVPLKTRRVGQRCTLNLSRAETSSRWCGVVVRRGGCQLRCRPRHLTMVQNYVVRRQKPSCS
ncbi:uncharacterized protein TNCV_4830221 [Trichonephila clavipes]|nr:uncharacterized protein TNCV_4830221 [Trichonephila clavipes]